MQGEAFAYAKYMRYADQARRDGNTAVAQLFTNTANVELNEHFASLATLAGLVAADTNANLNDAITGEQHEADVMYPDYAQQADQAGNPQAANLFREIAGDEKTHQQAFEKARTTPCSAESRCVVTGTAASKPDVRIESAGTDAVRRAWCQLCGAPLARAS